LTSLLHLRARNPEFLSDRDAGGINARRSSTCRRRAVIVASVGDAHPDTLRRAYRHMPALPAVHRVGSRALPALSYPSARRAGEAASQHRASDGSEWVATSRIDGRASPQRVFTGISGGIAMSSVRASDHETGSVVQVV
jgi:hypothetical protein